MKFKMSKRAHKRFQITMRVLCVLSFLWLLGVAGNSDLDLNTTRDCIVQASLATASFGLTAWLGGLLK